METIVEFVKKQNKKSLREEFKHEKFIFAINDFGAIVGVMEDNESNHTFMKFIHERTDNASLFSCTLEEFENRFDITLHEDYLRLVKQRRESGFGKNGGYLNV